MTTTPTLSDLEWSAVAIALNDAHGCGCAATTGAKRSGAIRRIATRLFGTRRPNVLADPKLEAVRRFVCTSARRRRAADEMAPALRSFGFSAAQIDAMALLSA